MSSIQAITTFVEISTPTGGVQHRFQNSEVGSSISLDGSDYSYLSFIYQGAAKSLNGDNLIAAMVLAANPVSMGYAHEAVVNRWNIKVDTCLMNIESFTVNKKLTTEFWLVSSMAYDNVAVELELSSSLDAISALVPNQVFTIPLVGHLPTSSTLTAR